ncbi:unnamed protein product [Owenia fusiformis]|uniref:C-type lectin domain-containing protein n=1 Tax=Owenia fusiformis TaxID=6347 RepID=A0A8S4NGV7_OWEFU|nr:unnamed protein product [Owenia fusiformis]
MKNLKITMELIYKLGLLCLWTTLVCGDYNNGQTEDWPVNDEAIINPEVRGTRNGGRVITRVVEDSSGRLVLERERARESHRKASKAPKPPPKSSWKHIEALAAEGAAMTESPKPIKPKKSISNDQPRKKKHVHGHHDKLGRKRSLMKHHMQLAQGEDSNIVPFTQTGTEQTTEPRGQYKRYRKHRKTEWGAGDVDTNDYTGDTDNGNHQKKYVTYSQMRQLKTDLTAKIKERVRKVHQKSANLVKEKFAAANDMIQGVKNGLDTFKSIATNLEQLVVDERLQVDALIEENKKMRESIAKLEKRNHSDPNVKSLTRDLGQMKLEQITLKNKLHHMNKKYSKLHNLLMSYFESNEQLGNITNVTLNDALAEPKCPESFVQYGENCYFLSRRYWELSWMKSKSYCEELGAQLVAIETDEEFEFLQIQMKGKENGLYWWTSGSDRKEDGHWIWESTNTDFEITNAWAPGQPSSSQYYPKRNCIGFYRGNAKLYNEDCEKAPQFQSNGYICERALQ